MATALCYSIFIPNHDQPHNPFSDTLITHPKFPHQTIHTQISLTGGGLVGSGLPSFNMQAKAEGSVFQTVSFGMVISLQFGFSFCYLSSMIKCNRCCASLDPDTTCSMMLTISNMLTPASCKAFHMHTGLADNSYDIGKEATQFPSLPEDSGALPRLGRSVEPVTSVRMSSWLL
jgi:hypothetical protein